VKQPKHILIILLSAVGDIILATPAAARLRTIFPDSKITWLVDVGYQDLVKGNPQIDRVVEFDYTGNHRGPGGIRSLAGELRPVDLLVDFQHKVRTLLLAAYLRPAQKKVLVKRHGFGVIKALIGKDAILRAPHQVERYLDILDEFCGAESDRRTPELVVDQADSNYAEKVIAKKASSNSLVGIFPSTRHPTKRWPAKYTAELADMCLSRGLNIAILGGQADILQAQAVVESMQGQPTFVHTSGSLGQLAGLVSKCKIVVSPDTGPAHMAAALKVPVIALFGPTSPERWAPRGAECRVLRQELPCSPCSNHGGSSCSIGTYECMQLLKPDRVVQSLFEVLKLGKE